MRRTLAFSIHELAVILGDQLTAADLVPIFNGFLKDLDEVRIGVLKHLYDFLKVSLELGPSPGSRKTGGSRVFYSSLGSDLNPLLLDSLLNVVFFFSTAPACRQEEGISVPAAGIYGDGQQSQLAIQIRVSRVRLLLGIIK